MKILEILLVTPQEFDEESVYERDLKIEAKRRPKINQGCNRKGCNEDKSPCAVHPADAKGN